MRRVGIAGYRSGLFGKFIETDHAIIRGEHIMLDPRADPMLIVGAFLKTEGVRVLVLDDAVYDDEDCDGWDAEAPQECLDHFVVIGQQHLNHIVSEHLAHYHEERPHQGLGNVPITGTPCEDSEGEQPAMGEIVRQDRLGGLLKHYERRAA